MLPENSERVELGKADVNVWMLCTIGPHVSIDHDEVSCYALEGYEREMDAMVQWIESQRADGGIVFISSAMKDSSGN